jgi:P4 family phage/plasmid primase-like protien
MLEYIHIIYQNKIWYIFNESNGIYEVKDDNDIIKEISNIVESLTNDNIFYNWFDWINKINYKKNLLEELKAECKLNNMLDNNPYLLGFPNGILELETKIFRKGYREEHTTMICGVNYVPEIDTSLAEEMICNAFIIEEEREFVLNKLAMCLDGKNHEQQISFLYGYTASNGKSFLMERMRSIIGDYGGSFPVTLLTNKMKGSGEANSSLGDFLNKRFMYSSEPESGSKLNSNMVKQLTGDIIKTRNLYQEKDIEIKPSYNIFVCCNTLPNFDSYDEGIARRINIIEFKTKFCVKPKKKNEKLLKKYNEKELEEINTGLMKILVDRYNKLYLENFVYSEPDSFKNIRKMFLNDNKDIIKETLLEMFEESTNRNDYIKLKEVKDVLKCKGIKEKDVITIIRIVTDTFENVEFKEDTTINHKHTRTCFLSLKSKN